MNDPYVILGVARNATKEQINNAYRTLARKYSEEGNITALNELNDAYDAIVLGSAGTSGSYSGYSTSGYSDIRARINSRKYEDALTLLEGIPESARDAEWYYLKGVVCKKKGWLEESLSLFSRAHTMDPTNITYEEAYNDAFSNQNGGYRAAGSSSGGGNRGCSFCDICTGLICADTCCECMGGDIISCC